MRIREAWTSITSRPFWVGIRGNVRPLRAREVSGGVHHTIPSPIHQREYHIYIYIYTYLRGGAAGGGRDFWEGARDGVTVELVTVEEAWVTVEATEE
jgi:hypothetical protein